jgi:hypothetical protein
MALSTQQLRELVVGMAQADQTLGQVFTKPDLVAAAQAIDTYLTDNAAAINTALPQPFRGTATNAQKAQMMSAVALRRWAG